MRSSILTLQSLLDQAKERLKDVEENIKKSTGRDFTQNQTNRFVRVSFIIVDLAMVLIHP